MSEESSRARLPSHEPSLPVVYVDWNVSQFLKNRRTAEFGVLLQRLVEARLAGAAWVPHSIGHVMDATAGWTRLEPEYRAERLRDIVFLDGLSAGWMWEMSRDQGVIRHRIEREPLFEACERRGHFTNLRDEAPELLASFDAKVHENVNAAIEQIRATAAGSPNVPPELAEAMVGELQAMFADGLPEISDAGRLMTAILRPAFLHSLGNLPTFDDVPPEDVISRIEQALLRQDPSASFERVLRAALEQYPALEEDDLGPMMLGCLGYHRERRKDVVRGAPGILADQSHSRCALSSAIFLTGDGRLQHRLAAWAAHTGRGVTHDSWPVLLHVAPDDVASVESAATMVHEYTRRFEGLAHESTRV